MMNRAVKTTGTLVLAAALAGCAATTTITTTQNDAKVFVKASASSAAPRSETFNTTSFGNFEFRALAEGNQPFYGILPLKFNGGYLALDILFFAPAAFFNLREVYPYYDFDVEKRVVKYKIKASDEWNTYVPLEAESVRAQDFYKNQ